MQYILVIETYVVMLADNASRGEISSNHNNEALQKPSDQKEPCTLAINRKHKPVRNVEE